MTATATTPRQQAIDALLQGRQPLRQVAAWLDSLPADTDAPVTLARATLMARLQAVASGQRSAAELETWALMVLAVDDLVYEDDSEAIAETVFALAHPGVRESLPPPLLAQWMARLGAERPQPR